MFGEPRKESGRLSGRLSGLRGGCLKSSLKYNTSESSSSATSSASSSLKNVRFAAELTTVKNFDSAAEPISISTESSPQLKPVDVDAQASNRYYEDDGLWFNNLTLLPSLLRNKKMGSGKNKKNFSVSRFYLDYDSDSGLDDDDEEDEDDDDYEDFNDKDHSKIIDRDKSHSFEVVNWQLVESNVSPFKYRKDGEQLQEQLFDYLQGSNIRLHSLEQVKDEFGKILGLIYVNNLNFEKFIEIKLTFNDWKDLHYITATYHRSITDRIDEFKFIIDLNVLKYSLEMKKLLYCDSRLGRNNTRCPLNVEFCCRYDVNYETFYDNNNYENYQMKLIGTTQSKEEYRQEKNRNLIDDESNDEGNKLNTMTKGNIFARDFLVTTTLSHSHRPFTSAAKPSEVRTFSDDTDYYNTSPLRHLYHNDTTLIKPAKKNKILINSNSVDDGTVGDADSGAGSGSSNMDIADSRSVSDSTSTTYSSPSDDMNLMDSTIYYRYPSTNSLSSLELSSDLTMNHYNYSSADVGMGAMGNLDDEDTFDDMQSIVTDTIGDVYYNHDSAPRNNSVETLLTPGAMHRLVSSNSGSPSTSNNNITGNGSGGGSGSGCGGGGGGEVMTRSRMPGNTKDMDYQTFLNSYCFCNHPHREVLERSYDGTGSSIQAI